MLPPKFRLKIRQGTGSRWQNKRQVYTPVFKAVYRFGNREDLPKIGFIVSGKLGGAVKRNRLRRLLSEGVRTRLGKFPKGIEVLLIAQPEVSSASYEEICSWIDRFLSKIYLANL